MARSLRFRFVIFALLFALPVSPTVQIKTAVAQEPISVDLPPGTPLGQAMQVFADMLGVSILLEPGLEDQTVTARLTDIPVMEAFEAILKANRLWYERNETGNVYLVKQADVAFSGRVTERILVNFVELTTLETIVQQNTSTGGSYIMDERTNSFVVTNTPQLISELRQVISALDVPNDQVIIEAEIAAIDQTELKELGIQWDFIGRADPDSPIGTGLGTSSFTDDGEFTIGFLKFASDQGPKNVRVTLEALERDGLADILARPRLLTINRQAATLRITEHTATGTRVVQSTSALGQTVTEPIYSDVGVTLDVTPSIAGDSLIVMQVKPTVSSARRSPFFPTIAVDTQERTTETRVMARDGQTIVIGGLFQRNVTEEVSRVPLLGHIPVLGYLFRQSTRDVRKTELVIFLTPRIVTAENLNVIQRTPETEIGINREGP